MEISTQLISPLPVKSIQWSDWWLERPTLIAQHERVLFFDPKSLYGRISIDPFKRHQGLSMDAVFPKNETGQCACGCDVKPKEYSNGKFHKWSTPVCQSFASDVLSIINNYFEKPSKYMTLYSGKICDECKDDSKKYDLQLDHIIGVKQGGGGCWLSNYRWLCHDCHRIKTCADFGWKNKKGIDKKNQTKLL